MTSRSVAVYGSCGAVLIACLAAANMPSQDAPVVRSQQRAPRVLPDAIAVEVQSQASRLHARMAEAPTPSANVRNPFAFGALRAPHRPPGAEMAHAAVAAEPAAFTPAPPQLVLMGMAEESTPAGPRRTAIIGTEGDDVLFVHEGDTVAGRYRVTKIGADAVELQDVTNNAYRRIALR
jgi:hypothetical protein